MMEAFEGLAEDSSLKAVTFSAVIEAGGVSRSYAYRLYPRGVESMVQELHEDLLDQGIRALRTKIRELEPPITFDQAVRAGIEAVVDTIYDHSLTTRVFGNDPLLLRQYLAVEQLGNRLHRQLRGHLRQLEPWAARDLQNIRVECPGGIV